MKIQFESDQTYQQAAIRAVVDCFRGQSLQPDSITPVSQGDLELIGGLDAGSLSAVGNRFDLPLEILGKNLQEVQERNDLDGGPFHKWILNKISEEESKSSPQAFCPHYSVEMETGTGKTYVYLRTIFELNKNYGFKKFLIVVPSVAIREGVMNSLRITKDHFAELYNRVPCEFTVYDSKKITQLRQFASSNQIQILVINIQAFRSKSNNVIYQDKDAFHGQLPIDLIRATRPIVIMDEPQSIDSTEGAQESIKELFPLCTLRYSATHKNPYNLLYKLNPVQAFQLGLVKKIHVSSVTAEQGSGSAWIKVDEITYKPKLKAKIRIQVKNAKGEIKEVSKTIKNGDDLYTLSGEMECYRNGYVVREINATPDEEFIGFTNSLNLRNRGACSRIFGKFRFDAPFRNI